MYMAEKVIDVLELVAAEMLGSNEKIFPAKLKFAKGRNLSHSPVSSIVSTEYAIEPPKNTPIEIPTEAAVFRVMVDNIRAITI